MFVSIPGTFGVVESNLQLFTVLIIENNVAVPLGFMLSSCKDTATYEAFFRHLNDLTNGAMDPSYIVCDFEKAISEGVLRVWPAIQVLSFLSSKYQMG